MSEDFDAYHKWLAIPPKDQPPNHYRLLGLDPMPLRFFGIQPEEVLRLA